MLTVVSHPWRGRRALPCERDVLALSLLVFDQLFGGHLEAVIVRVLSVEHLSDVLIDV